MYGILGPSDHSSGLPPLLSRGGPSFSDSKDISLQERWTVGEVAPGLSTDKPAAAAAQLPPETAPRTRALVRLPGYATPPSCVLPEPGPRTLKETQIHDSTRVALPPFSTLFPLIPPRIPPEPHITLLSLGAERFQLSDTAMGELDMMLCVARVRRSSLRS